MLEPYELKLAKGPQELENEVLSKGRCTVCGACVGVCPYIKAGRERISIIDSCGLKAGQCYEACPRTLTDYEELNKTTFGKSRTDYVLGTHEKIVLARSTDENIRQNAQYGGTVSGLVSFALKQGIAEEAIASGSFEQRPTLTRPVEASKPDDFIHAGGSRYTAGVAPLSALGEVLKKNRKLAIVGRPCQVVALRKKQMMMNAADDKFAIVIGLFCMWALDFRKLENYLKERLDIKSIVGFDVPEGQFIVKTDKGDVEMPFEEVKAFRLDACDQCYDFTNELADLSVGSTEWLNEWNTLIIRSEKGRSLVDTAIEAGVIEIKDFPADRLEKLTVAARNKKQRVLKALKQDDKNSENGFIGYLKLDPEEIAAISG